MSSVLAKELAERLVERLYNHDPICLRDIDREAIKDFVASEFDSALPKWVACSVELPAKNPNNPNNSIKVLQLHENGRMEVGVIWFETIEEYGITHWMPLPALPAAPSTDSEEK